MVLEGLTLQAFLQQTLHLWQVEERNLHLVGAPFLGFAEDAFQPLHIVFVYKGSVTVAQRDVLLFLILLEELAQ